MSAKVVHSYLTHFKVLISKGWKFFLYSNKIKVEDLNIYKIYLCCSIYNLHRQRASFAINLNSFSVIICVV